MITDPISDMIARIKNGLRVQKNQVQVPHSKLKENIAKILVKEGILKDYKKTKKQNKEFLQLFLKYEDQQTPVISEIKRISKPGRRFYVGRKEMGRLTKGFGFLILSTPKGVMTDKNAKKAGVGGEVICRIW